jgi:hypothetical protein
LLARSSSAYSLLPFHHSTNIGSRIDLIDDLEVVENLPRRELFDFLLVQAVEPIKECPLVRRQFRHAFWREAWRFHLFQIMLPQRNRRARVEQVAAGSSPFSSIRKAWRKIAVVGAVVTDEIE